MPGKPFPKGTSPNPGGRKRGIERMFQELIGQLEYKDKRGFEALIARLSEIAFKGSNKDSTAAIKLMFERALGYPQQSVELVNDPTAPQTEASPAIDWSKVPLELRRQLLAALTKQEPDDGSPTEH